MTKLQREFISRATMIALGIALLIGSYKSFKVAQFMLDHPAGNPESISFEEHRYDGMELPVGVGVVLLLPGVVLLFFAMLPVTMMEKFTRPPKLLMGDDWAHGRANGTGSQLWF